MDIRNHVCQALETLRAQKPLVVNITNYVVMNNTANALLAVGASPIMAHSRREMEEMVAIAGALVINIGTLDEVWIERMCFAIELANRANKPVVLDPVGCGASQLRTETAQAFMQLAESLTIRGNSAEIIALSGMDAQSKGVDSLDSGSRAVEAAKKILAKKNCRIVISGETDYVVTPEATYQLNNGDAMMPFITGMGCSLTALTGAFAAIGDTSGLAATAVMGIAGEIAVSNAKGPGSFQPELLDALYQLDEKQIKQRLKAETV
ncbi:hydroxyethylthiazole kinase [Vibrio sp. JC009]|uniref:hydroxyethylthiazole kinase n=1 Tax=Vibrio sp. JC009 TaxID=2912314 RepID=UPI0023B10B6F|nr:hydroxyethylthiazole kinase [Vibrio sp. JC009]WED24748.1 hydroxyethylthiazole kinase [Vibrio sp. JC009]